MYVLGCIMAETSKVPGLKWRRRYSSVMSHRHGTVNRTDPITAQEHSGGPALFHSPPLWTSHTMKSPPLSTEIRWSPRGSSRRTSCLWPSKRMTTSLFRAKALTTFPAAANDNILSAATQVMSSGRLLPGEQTQYDIRAQEPIRKSRQFETVVMSYLLTATIPNLLT